MPGGRAAATCVVPGEAALLTAVILPAKDAGAAAVFARGRHLIRVEEGGAPRIVRSGTTGPLAGAGGPPEGALPLAALGALEEAENGELQIQGTPPPCTPTGCNNPRTVGLLTAKGGGPSRTGRAPVRGAPPLPHGLRGTEAAIRTATLEVAGGGGMALLGGAPRLMKRGAPQDGRSMWLVSDTVYIHPEQETQRLLEMWQQCSRFKGRRARTGAAAGGASFFCCNFVMRRRSRSSSRRRIGSFETSSSRGEEASSLMASPFASCVEGPSWTEGPSSGAFDFAA
ncbi:hypothetical protein cyc_09288 [Cyclospora cayetanensis]|uniref:Uncharacterized protein n=1 Tax=Cyclospora cayetanensis TaxID=88456 RepID=A0A1D3D6D6_9EIME|nr:hypothetical protein cyc_09288 [Cyclospora cayetanensis]